MVFQINEAKMVSLIMLEVDPFFTSFTGITPIVSGVK